MAESDRQPMPSVQKISALVAALLAISTSGVRAAPSAFRPDSVFLQLGDGNHTRTATAGVMWDLPWHAAWAGGTLSSYVETSLGRWWIDEPGMSRSPWVSQVGITPVLRWHLGPEGPWFAELGIGANVLLPAFHDNDRRFGTAFNFGDHLALGRALGDSNELALRVQHYSNGGIKQPNPGINFVQLRWIHRF
jgi:hypothetical protein